MFFFYTFTNYKINNFHDFIKILFENIFNNKNKLYYDKLIPLGIRDIFQEYGLITNIKEIHRLFHLQEKKERERIKKGFNSNNRIEDLCKNKREKPLKYSDFKDRELADQIKSFFNYLYKELPKRKKFFDKFGTFKEYFEYFRKANNEFNICPFCGLTDLKSWEDKIRDDNDHYFSKGIYSFNSINFYNLVPACSDCNQGYKLQKDIIFNSGKRKKVFYPYNSVKHSNSLFAKRIPQQPDQVINSNWEFSFSYNKSISEEMETWDDIYEIKFRYNVFSRKKIKQWLVQFNDFYKIMNRTLDFENICSKYISLLESDIYLDHSFIKKAIFNEIFKISNLQNKIDEAIT
jgi:hypothetical protein